MGSLGCIVCERAAGKILRFQVVAGGERSTYSRRECKSASVAGIGVLTGLWEKIEPLVHETEQFLPTAEVEIAGQSSQVVEEGASSGQFATHSLIRQRGEVQDAVEEEGQEQERQ